MQETGSESSLKQIPRLAAAAAVGGLVGLAAESAHRYAGVWELLGSQELPVWIVAVYAACLLAAGVAMSRFESRYALVVSRRRLVLEAGLFAGGFLSPMLFHEAEWALLLLTTAYLAGRLRWGRERGDVEIVVFVVVVDLAVEGALVAASFYRYANAGYLPLPLWLAPLWGGLAFSLRRFFRVVSVSPSR